MKKIKYIEITDAAILKFISKIIITFRNSKKILVNELNLIVNEFIKHPNFLFLHE